MNISSKSTDTEYGRSQLAECSCRPSYRSYLRTGSRSLGYLFNQVYVQVPRTLAVLPNLRPVMNKPNNRTSINYPNTALLQAWQKLLQAPDCNRDALRLDIITVGRQLLGNYFLTVKDDFDRMYEAKDLPALKARAAEMREILNDWNV